ncbi:hypothetical protein RJ639_027319 [Escallonia herrerae]|uniref:Uncharacterized protein n=1 Tax=Escallonia herrerae TaxID=1293975 RepID=A0AA89BP09_9ASTE|nr:hypothetical protein RJ639_027319 [Escallonia herrerae]
MMEEPRSSTFDACVRACVCECECSGAKRLGLGQHKLLSWGTGLVLGILQSQLNVSSDAEIQGHQSQVVRGANRKLLPLLDCDGLCKTSNSRQTIQEKLSDVTRKLTAAKRLAEYYNCLEDVMQLTEVKIICIVQMC